MTQKLNEWHQLTHSETVRVIKVVRGGLFLLLWRIQRCFTILSSDSIANREGFYSRNNNSVTHEHLLELAYSIQYRYALWSLTKTLCHCLISRTATCAEASCFILHLIKRKLARKQSQSNEYVGLPLPWTSCPVSASS